MIYLQTEWFVNISISKTINLSKSKNYIVKTSFALFLEKGYKEVTIKNIMEATGLSKGAIYHHFNSKEAIYFAALNTYYFNLIQNDHSEMFSGDFKYNVEQIYLFIANLFESIENIGDEKMVYPIRNFFSFQLESETNETVRSLIINSLKDYRAEIKELVITAKNNKEIRDDLDTDAITFQIISLVEGTALHHSTLKNNVKQSLVEVYKNIFDNYFKMICT